MRHDYDFDYIVIGSGFGGSVSALRLTEKGYRVGVMEMGRRWNAADFPKSNWNFARWIWRPRLGLKGFFNIRFFRHVAVLHGCAVGGGSITYAATLLVPPDRVWKSGTWAGLEDWTNVMPRHFATAERMLGVTENSILGPGDSILKQTAEVTGLEKSFYRTRVGIFQPRPSEVPGETCPDPFFGGKGPDRATCIGCGGCMTGCRHNAKNTLDKNYLYLAEKLGTQVFAETRVVDVKPLNSSADGQHGYEVTTRSSTAWQASSRNFRCRAVVFAASALGTTELLLRLKLKGSLPRVSDKLGDSVRTNAESLIGVRIPGSRADLSNGVAIGSGVYLDEETHIEATRYPAGSDAMALLVTIIVATKPGPLRILAWIAALLRSLVRNPIRTLRVLQPFGFARESVIFLCMQTIDGQIRMRLRRRWFWPICRTLVSDGPRIPTFISQANAFAVKAARLAGGTAMGLITEIIFNIPTTAHLMGGCPMAEGPEHGVIDRFHRVFGYKNMYICDGSVIAGNLGVNPSLTITALTERAMENIEPLPKAPFQVVP